MTIFTLILDDEPIHVIGAQGILHNAGIKHIETFTVAADFLRAIEENNDYICVIDHNLNDRQYNGFHIAAIVKEKHPKAEVIIVSSSTDHNLIRDYASELKLVPIEKGTKTYAYELSTAVTDAMARMKSKVANRIARRVKLIFKPLIWLYNFFIKNKI